MTARPTGPAGSVVPLRFEEYQDVRQALARADGMFSILLPVLRRQRKLDIRIEGVEETVAELKAASATVANAYRRHIYEEAATDGD